MWKKLGVTLIALLSTFSVVYAMNRDMLGNSTSFIKAYNGIGRIGDRYSNSSLSYTANPAITSSVYGMQKGDKVYAGEVEELGWLLISKDTYTKYLYNEETKTISSGTTPETAWLSFADNNLGKMKAIDSSDMYSNINNTPTSNLYKTGTGVNDITKVLPLKYSNIYRRMKGFNADLKNSSAYTKIIAKRNFTRESDALSSDSIKNSAHYVYGIKDNVSLAVGNYAFIPEALSYGFFNTSGTAISSVDLTYENEYWSTSNYDYLKGDGTSFNVRYFTGTYTAGATGWPYMSAKSGDATSDLGSFYTNELVLRPAVYLDLQSSVFAISMGNGGKSLTGVNRYKLPVSYTSIYNETKANDAMKLRLFDSSMKLSVSGLFQKDDKSNVSQSMTDSSIKVHATANANTTDQGINTISAIFFDEKGEFSYYVPMEVASNKTSYDLSLLGIPVGKYKIGFVNEVYNENSKDPANCSDISTLFPLNIIESYKLAYTPSPKSQSTYEYDKNVEPGDKVGTITRSDGVVPIHYEIVADGSDTTYENFEIAGLDENGDSSESSLDVKVKASNAPNLVSATNSLKAGTYKFCIVSKDANGDPVTDVLGQNKVCVSLKVDKTASTISFTDATKKDMAIGDSAYIGDITYSNTDTVVPGNITYALTNGISGGVLTVVGDSTDTKKYNASILSSYTGNSLPTTYDLNVTIAETDNYKEATTTVKKQFYIYKDLSDLTWSPTKAGSFSTGDVGAGAKVGSLLAVDGVENFTYEFAKKGDAGYVDAAAVDNGDFTIAGGSGVGKGTSATVNTSSQLSEKTYKLQFKVTDSKGKVVYKSVEIVVKAQNQSPVVFKTGTGGTPITQYKMKVNEKNRSLFAEGGSTGATIEYYLANASDQPSGLVGSASDYADIAKIGGLISPKKVGTINVYAKSPGNATYGDQVSSFMNLIIEQAEQSVKFTNTNATSIKIDDTSQETATGTVTLTSDSGVGGITYKSNDEKVVTVDANGKVTAIGKGTAIITATLNSSDSSNTNYNPNYETKTTTKTINVYKGMSLTWTAASTNLKAVSSVAGELAGTITVKDNNGSIKYLLSTNTGVKNADAKYFQLDPNNTSCGVKLIGSISATEVANHNNKFYIQVDVTDSNGTQTIDIEITIDNADNDVYFKDGSNKVTKITKQFGENGNAFNFSVNTSNGGNVEYSIVTSEVQDVVTTTLAGAVTIEKVGKTKAQAVVDAGGGFDGKTVTIDVEITKGTQEVTFDDTTTTARAFVKDSQFSEPATLTETSTKKSTLRGKTYDSKDKSICTVDQSGLVTMLAKGDCEIEVTNKDSNWITTTATKTINLYDGMGVVFAQTDTPQADTSNAVTGSLVGKLTISGGQGSKTSIVSTSLDPKNKDAEYFDIKGTNVVLKKGVTAADLAKKYDSTKQKYVMYVQFDTTDGAGTKITTDAIIEFKGAPLNAEFDTKGTGKITEVYGEDRKFLANVINNTGGGTPVYQLKVDSTMPNDVLAKVEPDGTITIANANDKAANANPVMIEAVIPPSGGYEGKTIEVEVEITKAEQTGFRFKTPTINMQTESSVTVVLEGKLSEGNVKLISPNTTILSVNGMDITAGKTEDSITITARDDGDRNYKPATATATVNISSQPAYEFLISVPSATYGDTGLSATIEVNDATGTTQTRTWTSSDPAIADVDANGNITIFQAGQVDITCTQASTGEPSVSSTATLVIKPKPITITINDKSKYVGEAVPGFDMTIPNGVLVPGDTISLPNFSCLDIAKKPVTSTTPGGSYPITGTYPTGANANYDITVTPGTLTVKQDTSLASWFHLEGVTSGNTLDPTKWYNEDVKVVLDSAVETSGTYDEISLDQTLWDATSITVTQEDENSEDVYFRINASGILSTNQSTTIKIDKTKPIVKSITGTQTNKDALSTLINNLTFGTFFKPGTLVSIKSEDVVPSPNVKVSGLQEVSYEVYEIDRKTGIINSAPLDTGTDIPDVNGNVEVKLNDVGLYRVCAIVKDNAGNVSGESCSDVNIKKLDVDIDNDGENEFQDPGNDGCPDINIALKDEKGVIYKINVDRDGDGIPDLNIDSDGDGIADINVDTDKDGKPDLNLVILDKWEPTFCAKEQIDYEGNPIEYCTMKDIKAVINVDTGNDGIPDIDIDTNGDMIADFNITKDGKTPSINIGKLHEWNPKNDCKKDEFQYDTIGEESVKVELNFDSDGDGRPDINLDPKGTGKPTLNIDINGDGVPDVDIDSDGDGIRDVNIDVDGNGIADENIVIILKWTPDKNVDILDGFPYDTMGDLKAKDTIIDEDTGIQIQKPGGSFLPNYSIKVNDVKDSIDSIEKDKIEEFVEDDMEIKEVYDVKLSDGTSTIQPDGSVKVRIPMNDEWKNAESVKVVIEQADGTYKEVIATVKDGYLEYETDFLGKVGIIADKSIKKDPDSDKSDVPIPDFTPNGSGGSTPDKTVKGNYTSGIGGAGTGDSTSLLTLICMGTISSYVIYRLKKKYY